MKRGDRQLEPELESLLRFRTATRQLPDDVRLRVLARSRAFLSASRSDRRAISRSSPIAVPRPPVTATANSQGGGLRRVAVAVAIAILAGAAGAVAALRSRAAAAPPAASPQASVSVPIAARQAPDLDDELDAELVRLEGAPAPVAHHAVTRRPHPAQRTRDADPLAEVELLQHAHLAYARRDFRGALALVAEHARRFPTGPLAEECEALRVESLLAAGHAVEAKRASAAFAARFPRSVLLPGIEQKSHENSAP